MYSAKQQSYRDELMAENVAQDDLAVIMIEGMHCHRCETGIQKALVSMHGVREVEVDFNSGQASILYDKKRVSIRQLMDVVNQAGYRATGFTQNTGTPK